MRLFLATIYFALFTADLFLPINAYNNNINNNSLEIISERIIGGTVVPITAYPYQLSFRLHGNHICGAVLLRHNLAVTAAHCLAKPGPYSIRAGTSNILDDKSGTVVHIRTALVHPKYEHVTVDYDIALLFLAANLTYSAAIKAIKLPNVGTEVRAGMVGTISGWGVVAPSVPALSAQLRAADLPVWSRDACARRYWSLTALSERMFCAGAKAGGTDSCMGDSGGPFAVDGVLFGLVSFGIDCAQADTPGVYANVPVLRSFIRDYGGL